MFVCVQTHCSQKDKPRDEIYAHHTHFGVACFFLLSRKCSFTELSATEIGSRFLLHLVRGRKKERERKVKDLKRRKCSYMAIPFGLRSNEPISKKK